jgi:hypothetical protein|tara:strand:- start:741 stop:1169 length:429 start_codon:yes stop_codon:yes gene_type:complete
MISKNTYLFYMIGICFALFAYLCKASVVEGVDDTGSPSSSTYYDKIADLQNIIGGTAESVRDKMKNLIKTTTAGTVDDHLKKIQQHTDQIQQISAPQPEVVAANARLDELSKILEEKMNLPPHGEDFIEGALYKDGVPIKQA